MKKIWSGIKKAFGFLFKKAEELEPTAKAGAAATPGIQDDLYVKGGYIGLRLIKKLFKKKKGEEPENAE